MVNSDHWLFLFICNRFQTRQLKWAKIKDDDVLELNKDSGIDQEGMHSSIITIIIIYSIIINLYYHYHYKHHYHNQYHNKSPSLSKSSLSISSLLSISSSSLSISSLDLALLYQTGSMVSQPTKKKPTKQLLPGNDDDDFDDHR